MHTTLIETIVKLRRGQGVSEPYTVLCPNCKGNIENDLYTTTLVEGHNAKLFEIYKFKDYCQIYNLYSSMWFIYGSKSSNTLSYPTLVYPKLELTVLLEYFNRAPYINVRASVIRTIHLSEHFYHCLRHI